MTLLLRTVLNKTELLKTLSNRTISFGFACNDNGAVVSNSGSPSVSVHDDLMTPLTSKVTVQSSMCQVRICQNAFSIIRSAKHLLHSALLPVLLCLSIGSIATALAWHDCVACVQER